MNTNNSASETTRDIDYNRMMWPTENATSSNLSDSMDSDRSQREKRFESFLCVVSFIAIMVLACLL